jgi:hypothetical protein
MSRGGLRIVLFSRSGFRESLVRHAATRDDVELVAAERLVGDRAT